MKIVSIVPGFGGTFYCGNCLRDSGYAKTLRGLGHDAAILPMYLPLTLREGEETGDIPVFYGAVNIYLKQQFPVLQRMPAWMEHFFDSRPLLRLAASKSGSTRAHGLEELTESMLLGEDGRQHKELDHLVSYLKDHEKPDIVHLSNALLLGIAGRIRSEVGVPVVCSLQDEDVWVDAMEPGWRSRMWALMAEKGQNVDAFVAVSAWFAEQMGVKMSIDPSKLHVIPIGIDPEEYIPAVPDPGRPVIGYLSRICEENGFGILTDAFIELKKEPRFRSLRLRATGGMTGDDKPFLKEQMRKLSRNGLTESVEFPQEYQGEALQRFFRDLTLLSVPVLRGEAFGLYQLEALASEVPLVQPSLGAFPEIIRATGGGSLYQPNNGVSLARAITLLLDDNALRQRLAGEGRKSVAALFDRRSLASRMVDLYSTLIR